MFAYILYAPNTPSSAQTIDFFQRFTQTPGLLHAFDLIPEDGSDAAVVAAWESREAAERYLHGAPLRTEVDQAIPRVRRVMCEVAGNK